MTNLLNVLPNFDTKPYTHILPSLEKALISTSDLLTLEAIDVAKRAQVPVGEVKKLADALFDGLNSDLTPGNHISNGVNEAPVGTPYKRGDALEPQRTISTLDDALDENLNGGIHSGYLTEITGER